MGETYRKDWACDIWEVWVEWERRDSPLRLHWQLEEPAHLLLELAHQTCVDAVVDNLEEAPVGACGGNLRKTFFQSLHKCRTPTFAICPKFNSKKKTGTLGRMHPRMVGRAAMAAAAGAGGGYMCLMPRMQLAPTHRHRCVLVLAPVDHIKMPSTRVYSRPLHAPHPILRHLDAKV